MTHNQVQGFNENIIIRSRCNIIRSDHGSTNDILARWNPNLSPRCDCGTRIKNCSTFSLKMGLSSETVKSSKLKSLPLCSKLKFRKRSYPKSGISYDKIFLTERQATIKAVLSDNNPSIYTLKSLVRLSELTIESLWLGLRGTLT